MKKHFFSVRSILFYVLLVCVLIVVELVIPSLSSLFTTAFTVIVIPLAMFLFQKNVEQSLTKEITEYKTALGFKKSDTKRSVEVRDCCWGKIQTIGTYLDRYLMPMKFGDPVTISESDKLLVTQIKQALDEFVLYFPSNNIYLSENLNTKFLETLNSMVTVTNKIFFHYLRLEPLATAYSEFEHTKSLRIELEKLIRDDIHLLNR